mmetsp:Transcript_2320/g.4694  ORF Transcript_2320/g.4694 Transcript_2320/m.4694 type:complete len:329 (-) Transcript_2320:252-1238(-)|eukprot:CAMPEP_0118933534 /NCGR_PEP_ID=MMETSP1169-20130426/12042_1 /TAXON_ID=36882 /ORGANISM="Pyramimonas obovata, Strain CCMP722" /LENGTH=328 /DNA_ID=CAMNT_0006876305 /DNA_START=37 /DNA_END=1023 /DNA_ORIENTATION=+
MDSFLCVASGRRRPRDGIIYLVVLGISVLLSFHLGSQQASCLRKPSAVDLQDRSVKLDEVRIVGSYNAEPRILDSQAVNLRDPPGLDSAEGQRIEPRWCGRHANSTWKHTGSPECKSATCEERVSQRGCKYLFNNSPPVRSFISEKHDWKATRLQLDRAIIKWFQKAPRRGDVLGISGQNYFNLVAPGGSTYTTADYPFADCHDLPYDDNSFDIAIANQVFEHVEMPWVCVDEIHRVLRPGGYIVIGVPTMYQEHKWPTDYWRFMPDSLQVLVRNFAHVEVMGKSGNGAFVKHMVDHPDDRRSKRFYELAERPNEEKWPCMAWVIARK